MIKRWLEFITESVEESSSMYWLEEDEVKDYFNSLTIDGYMVNIDKCVFKKNTDILASKITSKIELNVTGKDPVLAYEEYYPAWTITIISPKGLVNQKSPTDVTDDFQGALSRLRSNGYFVTDIEDDDGNISPEYVHLRGGRIITFIPEDGKKTLDEAEAESYSQHDKSTDTYIDSSCCIIHAYQTEPVYITPVDLAELNDWKKYTVHGKNIYCLVDIDDMARILSPGDRKSYENYLLNGIDFDNYYNSEYQPDIQSIFQYSLNSENEVLAIKALIKEFDSLDELIDVSCNDDLIGKSEEEVISYLISERYKRTLDTLCKDSEIIDEVKKTVGDWEAQAHCSANEKELYEQFDEKIEKCGIEFTKRRIEGKRFYYKREGKNKTKMYYDDEIWWYEVSFDNDWIRDYTESETRGWNLRDVFMEWLGNSNFDVSFEPHFSDYGDVDKDQLNAEIKSNLESYLSVKTK